MSPTDSRDCAVSAATPVALLAYESALAAFQDARSGAGSHLERAIQEAPGFVMAHVFQAWLLLCSRDLQQVRAARPVLARASKLPANERERAHLAAIAAVIADDYERAKAGLAELLARYPRDVLALQVAQSLDYMTGDVAAMNAHLATALPAWSRDLPGYHAVLAMHAFALEESGEYEQAEQAARQALDLNPFDVRAHHVMAHVFEMTDRPAEGMQWMNRHAAIWGGESVMATHCNWHLALFHLAQGEVDRALALYDARVRPDPDASIADLIDASALLWRVRLRGGDAGWRWHELAAAWAPHIEDRFCSFSDLHAMLCFVGAHDWRSAQRLERALLAGQFMPTRHGQTTRQLGLAACRALIAYGQGDHSGAITLLARLPALAHLLGGSHAQRDLLHLTMLQAIERLRRPARREPRIAPPVAPMPSRLASMTQLAPHAH